MAVFEQLRKLLDESVQDGEQRVRSYLDSIYSTGLQVILYGAGNVGRKTASILQEDSRPVACFADNNASLWGTAINGIEVMSPEEAVKRYADMGAFMVTAFNREFHADYRDIHNKLKNFGAKHIYPYPVLAWKYPDQLLPHFAQGGPSDVLPYRDQILETYKRFTDARSREVYLELANVSTRADYEHFSAPDPDPIYFPAEVSAALPAQITVADCGSYDGDTLRLFLDTLGPRRLAGWYAFEPDPENFKALTGFVSTLPRELQSKIFCRQSAVGHENGVISFDSSGQSSAKVSGKNGSGIPVESVTLDTVFESRACDMIKMDIEGFEGQALSGAKKCIKRDRPLLAVSVYHKPDDFFHLPAQVALEKRKYMLRRYMSYFFEAVYYDIPLSGRL